MYLEVAIGESYARQVKLSEKYSVIGDSRRHREENHIRLSVGVSSSRRTDSDGKS